jgi:cell division transport system ATP-binding protein
MMTEPETTPTSNPMPASPPSGQPQPATGAMPGARLVALVNEEPEVIEPVSSSGFGLVDDSTATPVAVPKVATIEHTGPELVPPPPPDPASILAAPAPVVAAVADGIEHTGPELVPPPPPDPASILAAPGIGAQASPTISEPIIALSNVSVQYTNGVKALSDIDLMIPHGDFVFLVGATGAGKSTILKLLYMDARATSGRVWVNGRDLTTAKSSDTPYVRRRMGIILQDFGLLPRRTVWENVAFACHVIGQSRRETRKRLPEVLERVGMLHRADAYPNELSGGEQQRVAIARALINDPPLLVADEPTGSLDPKTGAEIMDLLAETAARGTTVVVATHDKSAVDRLQKRVVALSGGRIIRDDAVGSYGVDDLEATT